jgi:hypothetical protein
VGHNEAGGVGVKDCGCLDKVRERLKIHHKSDVNLELKTFVEIDKKTGEMGKFGASVPPLYYKYKTGSKWKRSYVTFGFCPFCGKK